MSGPSPIRLSTAELRGRTRALVGSADSNTVKDRILGLGAGGSAWRSSAGGGGTRTLRVNEARGREPMIPRRQALHKSLPVGRAVELEEKLVILSLLLELPLQLAPVADEVEGEAEAQHAQHQQAHVHLGRQGRERPSRGAGTTARATAVLVAPDPSSLSGLGLRRRSQEGRGETKEESQEVRGPVIPHSHIRIPQWSTGHTNVLIRRSRGVVGLGQAHSTRL